MGSQGATALLGLLLIKLSVSCFSVPVYGTVALLLGLHALVRNAMLNPVLNLAIYANPQEGRQHGAGWLHAATKRTVGVLCAMALPVFLMGSWGLELTLPQRGLGTLLLLTLLGAEAFKTARLNLLHSRGQTSRFGTWTVLDAAAKPLMVLSASRLPLPHGALLLLASHAAGSLLMLGATALDPVVRGYTRERLSGLPAPSPWTWIRTHRGFLLPLLGVGVTAWVTGLSDRYLVNAFLGAHQAGIYAGIYALFSAPFLIAGTVILLSVRPRALCLAAEDRMDQAQILLWRYLGLMAVGVALLALGLYVFRSLLVNLLLAPPYAAGLKVVPGLLIGNAILALGTILEQHFYLQHRTHLVLLKQAVGSAAALISVTTALALWGFEGAGWACPLYTSLECVAGFYFLRRNNQKRASHTQDPLSGGASS
jgi:hypothetical protein